MAAAVDDRRDSSTLTIDNCRIVGTLSSPRFVGRSEELGRLESGLEAAVGGRAAALLVAGEAGVGKTRLVAELSASVRRRGVSSLIGACLDVEEGRLPFGPFIEALRPRLRELDTDARHELLAAGGGELARVLPELASGSEEKESAASALVPGRLFELTLGLLSRLATAAPVLLVVEDLHWSDRSTRDLFAFLVRNLAGERVLLVGTYRTDELYRGHPLRPFLAELERGRRLEHLELKPFTREELSEQLTGILGGLADGALVSAIFERSEGNAFFAEELVAAGGAGRELPPGLRDILLARMEERSPSAQNLLRAVAVGGRVVSDRLLAVVSELPEPDRLEALSEVVAHQLLVTERGARYRFRHELFREAVYQDILPGFRSRLHATYGAALAAEPELGDNADAVVGDLAYHWFAAHDVPRALQAAMEAGLAAERRSGFAEARVHYERVLELWDQVPDAAARVAEDKVALIRRTAEAASLAGDHGRAASLVRGAIDYVDSDGHPALAGILWERLGRFLWASGDSDAALLAYEQAEQIVPPEPPSTARARVLAARGQGLMLLARHQESQACCELAIAIARQVGARAEEGHALNTLGCDLAYLGDPQTAVVHLRDALAIAEQVSDLDDVCRAYLNLSDLLVGPMNRLDEALALALEGIERTTRMGMAGDYGVSIQSNAATALLRLGRFDEATEILRAAESRNPSEMAAIDLHQCRAQLDVCRGALQDAAVHLALARKLMAKTVDPPYHASQCAIETELALWEGRPGDARDAVTAGLHQVGLSNHPWLVAPLLWLGIRAQADCAAGAGGRLSEDELGRARDAGLALLGHAQALLRGPVFVPPATHASVLLCEAESERLTASVDAEPWERATQAWASLGQPYTESYSSWRLAEALLGRRRGREGAQALRHAHAIAGRIGARPLAQEITMLAQRARVVLTPTAPTPTTEVRASAGADRTGLTARQLEVLALIATGRTNREIAQALFITEKTAGAHVSSILTKLAVRSRVEAATTAHRLGLIPTADD